MPVISVANSKGGCGKTTLTLILATELAKNYPVTILDADPRQPIVGWASLKGKPENLTVIGNIREKNILAEIQDAAASTPFVFIDLEGTASRMISFAASESDLILIPIKEQGQDARAAVNTVIALTDELGHEPNYRLAITQSKVIAKGRTATSVIQGLKAEGFDKFLNVELHERDAFAALHTLGGTLDELDPAMVGGLEKARKNAELITDEVIAVCADQESERSVA